MASSTLRAESRACLWQGDGSQASWDGLRRDHDLWIPNGDCLVYLYDEGQSQRGPSMRVPYSILSDGQCTSLTAFAVSKDEAIKKLFLGAPADLSREAAFNWHVTTRNFFAWLLGMPLVGERLSRAMIDLLGRMAIYRESSVDNVADLLDYTDAVGYSDFAGRPELALAMLSFADEYKLTDAWIDAFAHCVGMHEDLSQCCEYEVTRNVNKALITRAALQMDLRLERVTNAVDTLLEEDLSPSKISLNEGSRRHLDHFRSFLHSHFVASYGYWPVRKEIFAKDLYESMQSEFLNLYDYLADKDPVRGNVQREQFTPDGISAGHSVASFDSRHTFEPLPCALPLLPDVNTGAGHRTQAHWALRGWKVGTKDHKQSAVDIVRSAYVQASNRTDPEILDSPLVQAYAQFESEISTSFDDKLSFIDSRKTRWIMVYGMLQTLMSITKAPEEVRDTAAASYPLCCPTAGVPTWNVNGNGAHGMITDELQRTPSTTQTREEPWTTRPCSMADYTSFSRNNSFTGGIPEKSQRRSLLIRKSLYDSDDDVAAPPIPQRYSSTGPFPAMVRSNSRDSNETAPSLNWSRGSSKSVSSSDGPASPISGSSSVYSVESLPAEKQKPVEPFIRDFFSEDGGFVCPGLSF